MIREQLLRGTYQPQAVKRVAIPKPDGGVRKLGIPTVLDRFIQQAVMQGLARQAEGQDGPTGQRPAPAEVDAGVSPGQRDGKRAGESGRRGNATRWAPLALAP
jgi:hypothetical protein